MTSGFNHKIYQDNVNFLQARMPEIAAILAAVGGDPPFESIPFVNRSGETNLMCSLPDGSWVALHNGEDIMSGLVSEMASWKLKPHDAIVFHGFGIGYGPLAALTACDQRPRIIIAETQPEVLKKALGLVDLRSVLAYDRLSLYVGGNLNAAGIIEDRKEIICFGTTRMVSHPAYPRIFGQSYRDFNQQLLSTIGAMRDVWQTAKKFGRRMISNTMDNLPSLVGSTPLASLKGRFKGIPAFYVAAGPSLDESLDELKKIGHRALIVSSDSAAAALISKNIMPHFVVTVDQHKVNFEKIRPVLDQLREPVLVFGVESNPDNVRACLSHRRIGITADSQIMNAWIGPRWNLDSKLPAINSVSLAAIHTAHLWGCEPIVLVGMDLGFAGTRSHSKAAANHYTPDKSKEIMLDGNHGSPLRSLPQLAADKSLIERTLAADNYRIINTAVNGVLVEGTEIKPLAEVVEQELKTDDDIDAILSSLDWRSRIPLDEIHEELQLMLGRLTAFKDRCQKGLRKLERVIELESAGQQASPMDLIEINDSLHRFQRDHQKLITLLEGARLDNVQELYCKRELIESQRKNSDPRRLVAAELEIISDFFQSQYETAAFFEQQTGDKLKYFDKTMSLMGEPSESVSKYLRLARQHAARGELWQAEAAYRACLRLDDTNKMARNEIMELLKVFGIESEAKTPPGADMQRFSRAS